MRLSPLLALLALGCVTQESAEKSIEALTSGPRPDELPVMLNTQLPFRYPPPLYERKVQGNVTLRIFVDTTGLLVPDSTRVEESSGYPGLDSAAVAGSTELRFTAAKLRGRPMAVSILLPVYFRHPDAPPLPGDTLLLGAGGRGARGEGTPAVRPPARKSP